MSEPLADLDAHKMDWKFRPSFGDGGQWHLKPEQYPYSVEELDANVDDGPLPELDDDDLPELERVPAVICGPSGAGKTTLVKRLMRDFPGEFRLSVSHTTRPPREGEKDGVDYHFVSPEEFEKVDFLERSTFADHSYGTSRGELQYSPTCTTILDLNLEGVLSVVNTDVQCRRIFVAAPSDEEIAIRLQKRGFVSLEGLRKRLSEASDLERRKHEVEWSTVIVNNDLEKAYAELKACLDY